ncbi:S41 family peptidase [Streptomyces halobius]|uniref:PDZ domain-containing protein n=1 Tax=Streptomyces halobius TaxID=2879846 RepID=A0ABY4MBT0_9ACTN|nr:S41 family peptidase [Streptomyces halobius]UQA95153.1 PDZ domain-containing protein [Streptomyces halobius]
MSGPCSYDRPRRIRRGAALTLVFASVLATGAATGTWSDSAEGAAGARGPGPTAAGLAPTDRTADRTDVERAASQAFEDGKSGSKAADEVVSRSGDRWSAIYTPGEFEDFQRQLDGRYIGVGLWLRQAAGGRIVVSRVQPDSPAARAGIAVGDRLRAVDGRASQGRPVTEVVGRLRGDAKGPHGPSAAAGTPVELDLQRGDRRWRTTLYRTRLRTQNVTTARPAGADGPTRIKITAFAKGTGEEVRRAVRGASPHGGLLLDLRGNTGGLVTEAVASAAAFLDGGLVATYDVRGSQRALYAEPPGNPRIPLVVLVDGGTMSAGELLAGALQDRGRAVVVGSPTFGKGSVQMPRELPDGSVAEVTVGHYRTPSGRAVDGRGITPDLIVGDGAEKRARTVLSGLGTGA